MRIQQQKRKILLTILAGVLLIGPGLWLGGLADYEDRRAAEQVAGERAEATSGGPPAGKKAPADDEPVWSKKRGRWSSSFGFSPPPLEETHSLINLRTAREILGFELHLPRDPRTSAAGPPKLYAKKEVTKNLKARGALERPHDKTEGPMVIALYPNSMEIAFRMMHPDVYKGEYFERFAKPEPAQPLETDNTWRLTKVNGLAGMRIASGYNKSFSTREARPAAIYWYDPATWTEYSARAPVGADLPELTEIAESIYR